MKAHWVASSILGVVATFLAVTIFSSESDNSGDQQQTKRVEQKQHNQIVARELDPADQLELISESDDISDLGNSPVRSNSVPIAQRATKGGSSQTPPNRNGRQQNGPTESQPQSQTPVEREKLFKELIVVLEKDIEDHAVEMTERVAELQAEFEKNNYKFAPSNDTRTRKELNATYYQFRQEELDAYKRITTDKSDAKRIGERFLAEYSKRATRQPDALPVEDVVKLGNDALLAGSNDPLILAYNRRMSIDLNPQEKQDYNSWRVVAQRIGRSDYPPIVEVMVNQWLVTTVRQRKLSSKVLDQHIQQLNTAIVKFYATKNKSEEQVSVYEVTHFAVTRYTVEQLQDLIVRCLQNGNVNRSQLHFLAGLYYERLAWKHRGNGFANKVTEQGWKGFNENMPKAHLHYQRAWHLDESFVVAPHGLIKLTKAKTLLNNTTPRFWFLVATNSLVDYAGSYNEYIFTLYPRWGGSHEQMLAFAHECLKTNRWDTDIPSFSMDVLQRIRKEVGTSEPFSEYPGVLEVVKSCVEGHEQAIANGEMPTEVPASRWALAAVILREAGEFELCRKVFERHDKNLTQSEFDGFQKKKTYLRGLVYALTGPSAKKVEATLQQIDEYLTAINDDAENTRETNVESLVKSLYELDRQEESQLYYRDIAAIVRQMQLYHAGEWVPLQFDDVLSGWKPHVQTSTLEKDRSLTIANTASTTGFYLNAMARFQPPYQIEATMYVEKPYSKDLGTAGIIIGTPSASRSQGRAAGGPVFFGITRNGVYLICYDTNKSDQKEAYRFQKVNKPQHVFPLRVVVRNGTARYFHGEQLAFEDKQFLKEPPSEIAFGQFPVFRTKGSARMKDLRIKKLNSETDSE